MLFKGGGASYWRISKACQQCRMRKIRCDGLTPCAKCSERHLRCEYRDKARQRRKKSSSGVQTSSAVSRDTTTSPSRVMNMTPVSSFHQHVNRPTVPSPNSVTATHQASPSLSMELYYGATSNFALMQTIYRDIIPGYTGAPRSQASEVEDGGAGLDMFQFRSIFFGIPDNGRDPSSQAGLASLSGGFISYSLAKQLLECFLETLYHLVPFQPRELFEQQLDDLYITTLHTPRNPSGKHIVLAAIAIAALNTEHYLLADALVSRIKNETAALADIVNIETVQTSIILMSFPVHLSTEETNQD
ncbi:hypothetical protein AbraIFM66951_004188 [Aspergillus brasiliensis]|uniref:Zn(2)-C6 fungal-type domain-containing protein n=1 Tax=Aspergillus brasiliensis TaxID=319629 RepID=A0A9W5YQ99_9EURO|nr:hypothetical protein AbraCBS73388_005592 [Aspergillus brasiliensis]GKZ50821.1 hypothetical protein AbraIFM66951_004188 [Aspergillus brasiliensis]